MKRPYTTASVAVVVLLLAGVSTIAVAAERVNETTRTCTVTDKDRTTNREGKSDARIYTEQCGTLEAVDLITRGQFTSADIFASLEPGHTYEITTVGWRIGVLSKFPAILGTPTEAN